MRELLILTHNQSTLSSDKDQHYAVETSRSTSWDKRLMKFLNVTSTMKNFNVFYLTTDKNLMSEGVSTLRNLRFPVKTSLVSTNASKLPFSSSEVNFIFWSTLLMWLVNSPTNSLFWCVYHLHSETTSLENEEPLTGPSLRNPPCIDCILWGIQGNP